jgi:cobalt-zinc-cadmium efflux system membrane fusion protein
MNLLNLQGRYKPAMLATMVLKDRSHKATVVPLSAIVREGNADHVFVETAPDTFTLRQITLGDEDGDRRVVSEGVSVDDKIVLDGAFHLNNERKRLALQGGGA